MFGFDFKVAQLSQIKKQQNVSIKRHHYCQSGLFQKNIKKSSFYSRIYSFFNTMSKKTSMRIIELNFS